VRTVATCLALISAVATEVHAECAFPGAFFSPPSGSVLPPNAVAFLFLPLGELGGRSAAAEPVVTIVMDGVEAQVAVHEEPGGPAYRVFRLLIRAEGHAHATLRTGVATRWLEPVTARYTFDPHWSAPRDSVRVIDVDTEVRYWTCSHNYTRNLTASPWAPAYRVTWGGKRKAVDRGQGKTQIVPGNFWEFFRLADQGSPPRDGFIKLGYANCFGETLADTAGRIYVSVAGLYADGSAVKPGAAVEVPHVRANPPRPIRMLLRLVGNFGLGL